MFFKIKCIDSSDIERSITSNQENDEEYTYKTYPKFIDEPPKTPIKTNTVQQVDKIDQQNYENTGIIPPKSQETNKSDITSIITWVSATIVGLLLAILFIWYYVWKKAIPMEKRIEKNDTIQKTKEAINDTFCKNIQEINHALTENKLTINENSFSLAQWISNYISVYNEKSGWFNSKALIVEKDNTDKLISQLNDKLQSYKQIFGLENNTTILQKTFILQEIITNFLNNTQNLNSINELLNLSFNTNKSQDSEKKNETQLIEFINTICLNIMSDFYEHIFQNKDNEKKYVILVVNNIDNGDTTPIKQSTISALLRATIQTIKDKHDTQEALQAFIVSIYTTKHTIKSIIPDNLPINKPEEPISSE
jgi:hypothetical protein